MDLPAPRPDADAVPCRVVEFAMRDGAVLVADLYGDDTGPRPVIVERTPYGRRRTDQSERYLGMAAPLPREAVAARFVAEGFLYLVQDCRGSGASAGTFQKYVQEGPDTADTIAHVRAAPWCDGFVGMTGFSYGATCQTAGLAIGEAEPDAVIVDCGGFLNAWASGVRQGGTLALKQATWAHAQALREARAAGDTARAEALAREDVTAWLARGPWCAGHSPLEAAPAHRDNLAAFWQNGALGDFWRRPGLWLDRTALAALPLDALFITSWHDTSLANVVAIYQACAAGARRPSLIIGPWSHGERHTAVSGETDFGAAAIPENGLGASLIDIRAGFLAACRAGTPPAQDVRYFEMGGGSGARLASGAIDHGGRWRTAPALPPPGAATHRLALCGSRLLSPPEGDTRRTFTADPDDPVPTLGGAINSGAPVMEGGMWDQNALFACTEEDGEIRCARPDVLVFATPPLADDLHLAGPVRAEILLETDRPDIDLAIKLIDWYPDGPALNLSDGILRARYRDGGEAPALIAPGEPTRLTVTANPVAALVRKGHRLRLDIAASNFPQFDVNPHTGGPEGVPGPRVPARITVLSAPGRPSTLTLTTTEPTP